MSVVFYKFKSALDYDKITFDGTGISVFDLKREIMISKKLGKGTDFDLAIYNAQTNDEYEDDNYMIARNTSVLVSRNPAIKPGRGTAQKYLNNSAPIGTPAASSFGPGGPGGMPRYLSQQSQFPTRPVAPVRPSSSLPPSADQDGINTFFKQQDEQWQQTQNALAGHRPIMRPPAMGRGRGTYMNAPFGGSDDRPPPEGYVCHRCGQKGHYKNQCPTLTDAKYDNRPSLKRTTGIPKTFLQTIQSRDAAEEGVMVSTTGDLVVVQTNDAAWKDLSKRVMSVKQNLESIPVPKHLECRICSKFLKEAVTSSCCSSNFCDECIRFELIEPADSSMRLKCPVCRQDQVPDQLTVNRPLRDQVQQYILDATRGNRHSADSETQNQSRPPEIKVDHGTRASAPVVSNNPPNHGHGGYQSTQNKPYEPRPQYRPQFRPGFRPYRPPPEGYVCHRCQQKGHWKHECPTGPDPARNFAPGWTPRPSYPPSQSGYPPQPQSYPQQPGFGRPPSQGFYDRKRDRDEDDLSEYDVQRRRHD